MKQYFGIDIGGTAVKLGIVDETGKVLCKGEQSVNFDGYQTPVLDTVRKAAKEFLTAQTIPVENLSGIGVSATGQIDSRKGIVAGTCGNFPNYIGSPIKAALEQDFGLPVTVANDANCMTLGEVWVGGAQGYTDVLAVSWATTAPTHWTAYPAPVGPPAAGNATPPPLPLCVPQRRRTLPGQTAAPSLPQQKPETRRCWPCWTPGPTRSRRALPAWCTSSTRS